MKQKVAPTSSVKVKLVAASCSKHHIDYLGHRKVFIYGDKKTNQQKPSFFNFTPIK